MQIHARTQSHSTGDFAEDPTLEELRNKLKEEERNYDYIKCNSNKIKKHIWIRTNNFIENICSKNLGGQFIINKKSFNNIKLYFFTKL